MPAGRLWRVRDRRTFAELRRAGRRSRSGPIRVTFLAGPEGTPPRLAMAVGRSAGPAVVRNRLRRRIRAVVAEAAPDLQAGTYLIAADRQAAALGFGELRTHVMTALQNLPRRPAPPDPAGSSPPRRP